MAKQSRAKQEYKRFDPADLKPLTDEDRKRLFPNGAVSLKDLKELKKNKITNHLIINQNEISTS